MLERHKAASFEVISKSIDVNDIQKLLERMSAGVGKRSCLEVVRLTNIPRGRSPNLGLAKSVGLSRVFAYRDYLLNDFRLYPDVEAQADICAMGPGGYMWVTYSRDLI